MVFMGYYLLDNPNPHAKQYSEYRNGKLSGGVLLHTTESPKERGAQPIANWIATQRRDYGSYHAIFDADTTILMAPDNYTVWHCAANGFNSTTMGVSWACRTVDLDPSDEWTRKAFKRCAAWLVDFWKRNNMDPVAAANFIPAPETRNRPGLTTHGDAQPADRSDAFTRHPKRAELEKLLLGEIAALIKPPTPEPSPEELQNMSIIAVDDSPQSPSNIWWLTNGIEKRRLLNGKAGAEQAVELVVVGLASNKRKADGSVEPIYAPWTLRGAKQV
jgi:hypothetical protein